MWQNVKSGNLFAFNKADHALFTTGAQCAMTAKSSLLGSVCSLLPVQFTLRDLGDNSFQWTVMTGMLSPV